MRKIHYEPLSFQKTFHDSIKSKVILSSGFGAGKTYSLVMKMFKLMTENVGLPGGLLCPTTKMYKRDVLPTIREICDENEIPSYYNKTDMYWHFPDANATVYVFHSDDDGQSIKGPNLAWGCINEITLISEQAFLILLSRVRIKKAKRLQICGSGTPEGFNWVYEYFVNPENPREDTELIFGNTEENKYLSESYLQILRDSYDELMQQQYIEGKFVNLTKHRCLWAFDRFKHTSDDLSHIPGCDIWVSCDFNVSPMSATLWDRIPFGQSENKNSDRTIQSRYWLQAWDEISIDSSNTYELAKAIKEKAPASSKITIYPDPAGGSRSTKSHGLSDIDILREQGFDDIRYKSKIRIRDCLNATNNMLSKNKILISKKCRNLIADAEQCVFREGVFEIDKSNPKRTHWLDGMKNMIDYEFPIQRKPAFREERIR